MKKKLLCAALLALVCFALGACGQKQDGMDYKINDDGTVSITGYTDKTTVTELAVPDEIGGRPVTEIADFGVCNAESLQKITIGKNVEKISSWALTNNQHVTEYLVDPANPYFTSVDGVLFSKDMKTLYFYPCGKDIVFDRFGIAQNTTVYAIPDGVETIASKAFYKCYYVNITRFPDSISRIEEKAFHRASALENFKMPASLTYIGKDAFAYDDRLTSLSIPAGVKEIGEYAFFNCTGMKRLFLEGPAAEIRLDNKWQPTSKGKIMTTCLVGQPADAGDPETNNFTFPENAEDLRYYVSIDEKNPAVMVSFDLDGRHYEFAAAGEKVMPANDAGDVTGVSADRMLSKEALEDGTFFVYDSMFSFVVRRDETVFSLFTDFSDVLPDAPEAFENTEEAAPLPDAEVLRLQEQFTGICSFLLSQLG